MLVRSNRMFHLILHRVRLDLGSFVKEVGHNIHIPPNIKGMKYAARNGIVSTM
jgi:hypothetical protein